MYSSINDQSELALVTTDSEKQRIIDTAVCKSNESLEAIMKEFNTLWSYTIAKVGEYNFFRSHPSSYEKNYD
ncbi:hypothetical protein [Enterococcus faecium]|uniref:hypothetical protein n=1 Tax=Enterococcus faecium TaxID=1352 RepID=UPI001FD7430B|nr:hypothetical protein [Enterococcus faecium]